MGQQSGAPAVCDAQAHLLRQDGHSVRLWRAQLERRERDWIGRFERVEAQRVERMQPPERRGLRETEPQRYDAARRGKVGHAQLVLGLCVVLAVRVGHQPVPRD